MLGAHRDGGPMTLFLITTEKCGGPVETGAQWDGDPVRRGPKGQTPCGGGVRGKRGEGRVFVLQQQERVGENVEQGLKHINKICELHIITQNHGLNH